MPNRYLFESGVTPYDGDKPFRLFVQTAETLMSGERAKWVQIAAREAPPRKEGDTETDGSSGDVNTASPTNPAPPPEIATKQKTEDAPIADQAPSEENTDDEDAEAGKQ